MSSLKHTAHNVTATLSPKSLHPHIGLQFHDKISGDKNCSLLISITLPDALFLDRNELSNIWGDTSPIGDSLLSSASESLDSSSCLTRLWDLSPAIIDIERPVRQVQQAAGDSSEHTLERSVLRLQIDHVSEESVIDIPLHARYLRPNELGYEEIKLFEHGSDSQLRSGVICGSHLWSNEGFDALPLSSVHRVGIVLPTGKLSHQPLVELGTAVVIWLGWVWLVYKMWRLVKRESKAKVEAKDKRE